MQIDENTEQLKRKELLKQAYLKIQELQHRLEEKDRAGFGEPIAIIGMGCRFPGGVRDAETLWKMLKTGTDTVGDIPSDRWDLEKYFDPDPGKTGRMYSRHGAFLNTIDQFDPHFFGISPREAEKMDPQQRLLLEIAWEALESSGQISEALQGSNTGVFVALNGDDYAHLMSRAAGIEAIDLYFGTGVARSIAAGRISYTLGLKGPCISLDTACSGSLVAVHLACQSLRMQECRMAVAGGVTLIITPDGHLIGSKGKMLSPAGRCKTFDAAADGYVRGEGCGIVVLKRLAEAQKDKDCILAVIRGTAINQDGRSSGMTAPNGLAQEEVIRKALADGGIDPHEVGYVETHGTGTILGDPIEVLALGNTYGKSHSKTAPVIIGAVKTNIGHLEAAAGIAGLLKTVLILQHGEIPPNLHFKNPNPHIPWEKLSIKVAQQHMSWPSNAGERVAAVSSFGFSGTNAHMVLESAPQPTVETGHFERPLHILTLSAKNKQALKRLSARYADYFEKYPDLAAGDVCFTANTGRLHHGHRLACIGSNLKELRQGLSADGSKSRVSRIIKGPAKATEVPPIAFLFAGQGSQYVNMGRGLYETQAVFRRTLARCSQILEHYLPIPLIDLLYPKPDRIKHAQEFLNQAACTEPALFSLEYALHAMLQSWGIQPSVVLGHGVGEFAAACIAGVFSLEAGLTLVAKRGKMMQTLTRPGKMATVFGPLKKVADTIRPWQSSVEIAAVNGPANIFISGDAKDLDRVLDQLDRQGIRYEPLTAAHALHSPLMEPILDDLGRVAAEVNYATPQIDVISNVTGRLFEEKQIMTAGYWSRQLRLPVMFHDSIQFLYQEGYRLFVEIGPRPMLSDIAAKIDKSAEALWLTSLSKEPYDWSNLLESLGQLYVHGARVNWRSFDRDYRRARVSLPTYPFQRKRYWFSVTDHIKPDSDQSIARPSDKLVPQGEDDLSRWYYDVVWKIEDLPPNTEDFGTRGRWLILADRDGVGTRLRERLEELGAICATALRGAAFRNLSQRCWEISPYQLDDYRRVIEEAGGPDRIPLQGIIHLWGLDLEPVDSGDEAQALACGSVLNLVKSLSGLEGIPAPRLWLVTSGAQAIDAHSKHLAIEQAVLWGMGRVIALELPRFWGGLVDLDPEDKAGQLSLFVRELVAVDKEDQVAFRNNRRFVARLARANLTPVVAPPLPALKSDGTYLITGGLGGLGYNVAHWMVDSGARYLVLTGRRSPSDATERRITQLMGSGARVEYVRADVADPAQVESAIADKLADLPPLKGIIHSAGVIDDGVLLNQNWQRFAEVMAPKVQGAWNLHVLSQRYPLDFLRALLLDSRPAGFSRPGELCRRQCFPGCTIPLPSRCRIASH